MSRPAVDTARCLNCTGAIRYDNQRGWVHQASGMRLCASGGRAARPAPVEKRPHRDPGMERRDR
jgi:hypothetical protein